MTREERKQAMEQLERISRNLASIGETVDYIEFAIEALEQESILDKIYTDIQKLRGCSFSRSDGIIDDVEDILDKYKAESEE